MEYCSPSSATINKGTQKIPNNFFHSSKAHLVPALIIKKKNAAIVTTVFNNADATIILCEIFKRLITYPN